MEAPLQLFGNWSSFTGSLASTLGDFSSVVCLGQERCLLGAPSLLFLQPLGVQGCFQHFPPRHLWLAQEAGPQATLFRLIRSLGPSCFCGTPNLRVQASSPSWQSQLRFPQDVLNARPLRPSGTEQVRLSSSHQPCGEGQTLGERDRMEGTLPNLYKGSPHKSSPSPAHTLRVRG